MPETITGVEFQDRLDRLSISGRVLDFSLFSAESCNSGGWLVGSVLVGYLVKSGVVLPVTLADLCPVTSAYMSFYRQIIDRSQDFFRVNL